MPDPRKTPQALIVLLFGILVVWGSASMPPHEAVIPGALYLLFVIGLWLRRRNA